MPRASRPRPRLTTSTLWRPLPPAGNLEPRPPTGKHSSVAGVNSRRRDKPLPPIVIDDPSDTVAMKRAPQHSRRRKSRERKAQRLEELEEKISALEADRDHWKKLALSMGAQQSG